MENPGIKRGKVHIVDIVDRETRSRMMSGIRGKNTKPEIVLRKALHARGFRYRLNVADLPGKPDMVFPRYKAAIFVNGCFWHRHPGCKYATMPSTNVEFWTRKFEQNVARDARKTRELEQAGYRVAVVWECETKADVLAATVERVAVWLLRGGESFPD